MLVKIWTLKVLLVIIQEEVRNTLLETGKGGYFGKQWQKTDLYPTVIRKEEFVRNELRYLAQVIPEQNVDGAAWFIYVCYSKM